MADDTKRLDGETEEIRDILIAISVVTKRLATKLENKLKQEVKHGQNEGTVNGTR